VRAVYSNIPLKDIEIFCLMGEQFENREVALK